MQDIREMQYRIKLVGGDLLPQGQNFAFLECDEEVWLAYRRGLPEDDFIRALEESWAAFRQMAS